MAKVIGGDKLEAHLQGMAERLSKANTVEVGFLAGGTASDGQSLPLRAALNEFGVPSHNQPPRPFFRSMIAEKRGEWPKVAQAALKENNYDTAKTLDAVGQVVAGQLVESIYSFNGVPLAASTIKAKGNDKQLVNTGDMAHGVTLKVNSGDQS